jgi:beta-lactamase superfamily II metal-dependent hydrolase
MQLRGVALLALVCSACAHHRNGDRLHVSTLSDVGLRFVFFDLGQADGMLVLYDGHALLMDAGESREASDGDRYHRIATALQSLKGDKHLDAFVLSHYHRDHVGDPSTGNGLWGVFDDGVTVDTLYDRGEVIYGGGGKGETQKVYERAVPNWLASGKARAHHTVRIGDTIELGEGLRVEVVAVNGNDVLSTLAKDKPDELETWPASENDYSVALKFTYGDFELFAGGDLTGETTHREFKGSHREGYHDIESSTAERVGDVEVYRANHHGSSHSSNGCFVGTLKPEVSIISSGLNNYGHPTTVVFDALNNLGRVFITGGADEKVRGHVARAVVGGDIHVIVEKGGHRYAVNGRDYAAKSDAEEAREHAAGEKCGLTVKPTQRRSRFTPAGQAPARGDSEEKSPAPEGNGEAGEIPPSL